jgi:hypothetical protein
MEWLDSLWAWVMSLIASLFTLFTSVSESHSVEAQAPPHPPLMDPLGAFQASESSKAAEVFEALAAQVPPMMMELPLSEDNAPPNM